MSELEILALDEATPQIIAAQAADTYLLPRTTKLTTGVLNSGVADGATADAFVLNSSNAMSTSGANLLSLTNNGVEKAYFDKDGGIFAGNGSISNYIIKPNTTANCWITNSSHNLALYAASGQRVVIESGTGINTSSTAGNLWISDERIQFPDTPSAACHVGMTTKVADSTVYDLNIHGQTALPAATTNLVGGDVTITAGAGASSSAGLANGGNVVINGGTGYGTGANGKVTTTSTIESDLTTIDQPFINFKATADADTTSAISTNTTSGATTHHVQVEINGTKAWIAVSTNAPS